MILKIAIKEQLLDKITKSLLRNLGTSVRQNAGLMYFSSKGSLKNGIDVHKRDFKLNGTIICMFKAINFYSIGYMERS